MRNRSTQFSIVNYQFSINNYMIVDLFIDHLVHQQKHLLETGVRIAECQIGKAFHLVAAADGIHHAFFVQIPEIDIFQIGHPFHTSSLHLLKFLFTAQHQQAAMFCPGLPFQPQHAGDGGKGCFQQNSQTDERAHQPT